MIYTKFTSDEFKTYTGKLLDARLAPEDDEAGKVDRFINRCVEDIQDFISANDFGHIDFNDISETQNAIINRASMMQADWILENSSFKNQSGYDATTGGYNNLADVEKRHIAPMAKKLLYSKIICSMR